MDRETAEELGIKNPRQYILFDAPKSNYGADLPKTIIFKRIDGGVLVYDEPDKTHLINMSEALLEKLECDPEKYTKTDLIKNPKGKDIAIEMVDIFPGFKRSRDMVRIIDFLIKKNKLTEKNCGKNRVELETVIPF